MSAPPNVMQQMMGPQSAPRIAEEGEWLELPQENDLELTETPDGGADIILQNAGKAATPADDDTFYENLAVNLDSGYLNTLAMDLLEKIERDKTTRSKRDESYAEGLRRTGIGKDAPGGADFEGASKAVHPMLTKAAVDFEARAMKEVFPAGGPTKALIPGTLSKGRVEKANRQVKYFNWLLTTRMPEFRPGLEQTLTQSAIGGVQYMRYRWHPKLRRPAQNVIAQDHLFLPYEAASLWAAERITWQDDITEFEYRQRVRDGIYLDADLMAPSMLPDQSKAAVARDKAEGKTPNTYNQDGLRRTYECFVYLDDLEGSLVDGQADGIPDGEALPYTIFIDETSHSIMGIVRNWEKKDTKFERMNWIVEWPFVPWVGAYPIGMIHMIGSLSAAATGALRALLDAAHIENFRTTYALKGPNVSGQSQATKPTQINYIKGGVGADDIRKMMMQVNSTGPSATLFQLLGFLVDSSEQMVRTTFEQLSENNPNAPVGTTYALIEQGLAVVSTIIGRMHYAMYNTLQVIHRITRMYVTDEQIKDDAGELLAFRADFQGPCDVIPVSDPGIPSDAHRFAQMQVVAQRADQKPQLYNQRRVEKMILERLRVPDPDSMLVPLAEPQEMNAANENVAVVFGRPIIAYPHQDHLAHLATHIDFMQAPMLGGLPIMAMKVLPPMLEHMAQHIVLWYLGRTYHGIRDNMQPGQDLNHYMQIADEQVKSELDKTIAASSSKVVKETLQIFQTLGLPQVIQSAQAIIKQMTPPPQNPQAAAAQATVQTAQIRAKTADNATEQRSKQHQADLLDNHEQRQADAASDTQRQQGEDQRQQGNSQTSMEQAVLDNQGQMARTEAQNQTKETINLQDNQTALQISAAEIAAGKHSALSTGRGLSSEGRGISE